MLGKKVGNFEILAKLGEGGMGEVYKGFDSMLEREVALKVLHPELSRRSDLVERFRKEAVILARLQHPNIATLYSFFREDGELFMVMEFAPGETLDKLIAHHRQGIAWRRATPYAIQILQALEHAHTQGVVHRDLKPSNIMVSDRGTVKVMDFGIARVVGGEHLTRAGDLIGTPAYMSPEQIRGKESDARSDLYSLGIVFYEMLTGRRPFTGQSTFELFEAHVKATPPPFLPSLPEIPELLEWAILRALEKSPESRFQTALDFRRVLELVMRPTGAAQPTRIFPFPSETRFADAAEFDRLKAEEEAARQLEEERRKQAEKAERQRLAREAEARRQREEAERQQREEEEARRQEALRKQAEEAELQRLAREAEARRQREEAERQRREEEEARRQEALRKQAEEAELQRLAREAEARRQREEAERQQREEEEARRQEALRKQAEEAELQRLAREAEARRQREEAERKQREAEEARRLEEERRKQAEKEARQRLAREAEARRQREVAERQQQEEEARRLEEERRKQAQEAERRQREETNRQWHEAEKARRLEQERRKQAEEAERQRLALEEEARRQREEAERQQQEEEARRLEEERRKQAEEEERQRLAREAEARRQRGEAERKQREKEARRLEEEKRRKQAEEEERTQVLRVPLPPKTRVSELVVPDARPMERIPKAFGKARYLAGTLAVLAAIVLGFLKWWPLWTAAPPGQGDDTMVQRLLEEARSALASNKFTEPKGDNAVVYLDWILKAMPAHEEARLLLHQAVSGRLEQGMTALRKGDLEEAVRIQQETGALAARYDLKGLDTRSLGDLIDAEKQRLAADAARQAEAQRKAAAEAARRADAQRQAEESARREAARQAEAERRAGEAKRRTEAQRQTEEAARREEARRQAAAEAKRQADAQRKTEEAARQAEARREAAEAKRRGDAQRKAEEEAMRQAEARRQAAEEAARQAEARLRAAEAARKARNEAGKPSEDQSEKSPPKGFIPLPPAM